MEGQAGQSRAVLGGTRHTLKAVASGDNRATVTVPGHAAPSRMTLCLECDIHSCWAANLQNMSPSKILLAFGMSAASERENLTLPASWKAMPEMTAGGAASLGCGSSVLAPGWSASLFSWC